MRIIAGKHRGRRLVAPKDEKTTRPITDRVKETLFNKLFSLGLLGEGQVADVFAGTGSLGLEALSRGAERCLFIEQDSDARKRLGQNIETLGLGDQSRVKSTNALSIVWVVPIKDASLRLVFVDPPYAVMHDPPGKAQVDQLIASLLPKLEPGGVVVLRSHKTDAADALAGYDGPVTFTYGNMAVHLYQRPLADKAEDEPSENHAV